MWRIASLIVLSLLAACGPIQSTRVKDQINAMLGLSKEQVLSCMGPPGTRASEGATEVWSYSTFGGTTTSAALTGNQFGTFGSATTSQDSCIVNLTMRDGVVAAANYRSQGRPLAPSLPCYPVLFACTEGRLGVADGTREAAADRSKDAGEFCRELYKDPRLDTIRGLVSLDLPPTLAQQSNAEFITIEQRPALSAYKELNEQCRNRIEVANPQLWKIITQLSPAPYENLKALYDRKITIGQFNVKKQELLNKLQAAIAGQMK